MRERRMVRMWNRERQGGVEGEIWRKGDGKEVRMRRRENA